MDAPLNRLTGMSLNAVDESGGSVALLFDGCTLASFNPHLASVPLSQLVGARVASVSIQLGRSLLVRFSGGQDFSISLTDADYTGPEAFVARFRDGTIVSQ